MLKGDCVMLPEIFRDKLAGINSTTFLTGMGVTGVVTTAYLTGRASFKAAQILERENIRRIATEMQDKPEPPIETKDKIKLVWPLYIPPISVGCTTITAIIMSNHTASKKIAALTVASGISERAFQEYKAKVVEKIGAKQETAVRDEIAQDRITNQPPSTSQVVMAGGGEVLCHDMLTGRYFMSDMEKLRQASNNLNYEIIAHDYASLSFFYDLIGLAPTAYSDYVGWRCDDHPEVIYSTVLSPDGRPCIAIDFDSQPHPEYSRLW
ncbi:MAG TPA: DUF6353 family protein [Scandinavium sp.]|jgi:hypothetical protein|uniref:DUF6353 family protein n=1 Tax=Scandinavium sp. TaxID=2830653 RepID=UPI002E31E7AA|nr:DUF6353 family protein [Scandinavium sp.]HEX4502752.1 DUF6353 family protein [Scandinavium sp.]